MVFRHYREEIAGNRFEVGVKEEPRLSPVSAHFTPLTRNMPIHRAEISLNPRGGLVNDHLLRDIASMDEVLPPHVTPEPC